MARSKKLPPPPLADFPVEEIDDIVARRTYLSKVMTPLNMLHLASTGQGGRAFATKQKSQRRKQFTPKGTGRGLD